MNPFLIFALFAAGGLVVAQMGKGYRVLKSGRFFQMDGTLDFEGETYIDHRVVQFSGTKMPFIAEIRIVVDGRETRPFFEVSRGTSLAVVERASIDSAAAELDRMRDKP